MDAWGLDCVVTGSQKGWMVPPGLAFAALSERAWRPHEKSTMPRFYFDLGKHRDALVKGQTPFTPAMSIFFGGSTSRSERMAEEGCESIFAGRSESWRAYPRWRQAPRPRAPCTDERFASDTVTAVKCPEGIEVGAVRSAMEDNYNIILAGGQGKLSGKIFRIGHLGLCEEDDINADPGSPRRNARQARLQALTNYIVFRSS